MNRLTNENDDLAFMCNYLKEKTVFDSDRIKAIHEKLKAYEVLEEQGLLIKLPCKIGTKLFCIKTVLYSKGLIVWHKEIITETNLTEHNIFEINKQWGKTIFLTQEEAEKTLK